MLIRNIILFHLLLLGTVRLAVAQVDTGNKNTETVYRKIETYSTRRKFTNLVHDLILRPAITPPAQPTVADQGNTPYQAHIDFEGKIIRRINIVTFDPFGYSVKDTTLKPRSLLEKSGNSLHVKTQHLTIRNRLLIHTCEPYDSLLVKESERLIRSLGYVHEVELLTQSCGENSDSVDVFIRVSDLWSILPDGTLSDSHYTVKLEDKNLAGIGHTFSTSYAHNYLNGNNAWSTYYLIPNIKNTYISTLLAYTIDENRNYAKSLNLERSFFSPLTRWAGGIYVAQQKQPGWIYKNDTTRLFLNSKYNIQDFWAASAWQIFRGRSETDRSTKMILSGRVLNIKYLEVPVEQRDLLDYYTNERFFMTGLGITSRKYVKQYYVFRFGTAEDVPVGIAYGLVGGYQLKNSDRWYLGLQHSWGNFFPWGYFGSRFEYGTFFNSSRASQAVLSASINYFSGLFSIGNWKFRQFAKPELTVGINRASYDRLSLNDGYGLNGFNSDVLSGTRRFVFVIQTQSYAPWNVLGFRFGPYLNLSFGMLGTEKSGFSHSRVYPQLGMGVLIKNDYLIIRYFQLSFAFYPAIPGDGNNVFKANPFRTSDFGFPDFIIGKPDIIEFR